MTARRGPNFSEAIDAINRGEDKYRVEVLGQKPLLPADPIEENNRDVEEARGRRGSRAAYRDRGAQPTPIDVAGAILPHVLSKPLDELLDRYANALALHKGDKYQVAECEADCSKVRSEIQALVAAHALATPELRLVSWIFKENGVHKQYPAFVDRIDELKQKAEALS